MLHRNTFGMVIILQKILEGMRASSSHQSCNRLVRSTAGSLHIETGEAVNVQCLDSSCEKKEL
jgi:hypothetical protein